MKKRALFGLALLASLFLMTACQDRQDDNYRVPDPSPDTPVRNHRFDGGATDPYQDMSSHSGGSQGAGKGE